MVYLAQSYEYRPYYRVYHTIYFSVNYSALAPAKQFCIRLSRWNGIQCVVCLRWVLVVVREVARFVRWRLFVASRIQQDMLASIDWIAGTMLMLSGRLSALDSVAFLHSDWHCCRLQMMLFVTNLDLLPCLLISLLTVKYNLTNNINLLLISLLTTLLNMGYVICKLCLQPSAIEAWTSGRCCLLKWPRAIYNVPPENVPLLSAITYLALLNWLVLEASSDPMCYPRLNSKVTETSWKILQTASE